MSRKQEVLLASSARTTSENSAAFAAGSARGARFVLDITAASGTTPTLDVKIQGYSAAGNDWVDLPGGAFAQKTGTGTDDLTIYPGIAETSNETVSDVIPGTYRAVATIGGTTPSFTCSLGAELLP